MSSPSAPEPRGQELPDLDCLLQSLTDDQIEACRGLLIYHLGGTQPNWTLGQHNKAGGYGMPLTERDAAMVSTPKNFIVAMILRICAAPTIARLQREAEGRIPRDSNVVADLEAKLREAERQRDEARKALDQIFENAANSCTGFGTRDNRTRIYNLCKYGLLSSGGYLNPDSETQG